MTVKTTGARYKQFLGDVEFWRAQDRGRSLVIEDQCLLVDGHRWNDDISEMEIPDAASVTVTHGDVYNSQRCFVISLVEHFRQWENTRGVEISRKQEVNLKELLLAAGEAASQLEKFGCPTARLDAALKPFRYPSQEVENGPRP